MSVRFMGFAMAAALLAWLPVRAPALAAPADDLAFLGAATWGPTGASYSELRAKGRELWIRDQLRPPAATVLPDAARAQVGALAPQGSLFDRLSSFDAQMRAANALPDVEAKKASQAPGREAMAASARDATATFLVKALYGEDQVRQRMTFFWLNRFSVHQGKSNVRAMVGDYVETAIRPRALGRFRDLLGAVVRHPAMLRYLDNADNAVGHVNENYARELLELHTMGVGGGYAQSDVEALARILTGVGVDVRPEAPKVPANRQAELVRDGAFEFNPARHDYGDKVFLGRAIRGQGLAEVDQALDAICVHPSTARNVTQALATYFLGGPAPAPLARKMEATFARTGGDIAAVLGDLLRDPVMATGTGARLKDPIRYVLSAVRLAYDGRVVLNTAPVSGWLNKLGEAPFNRATPDGYPLDPTAWTGPGQMTARFEVARQIATGSGALFKPTFPGGVERPAYPQLQNAFYYSTLSTTLGGATIAALDEAASPQDWNFLFLASPEFMR